jgi:hypothetical protein
MSVPSRPEVLKRTSYVPAQTHPPGGEADAIHAVADRSTQ